jgi:predicted Zn-dependent protease
MMKTRVLSISCVLALMVTLALPAFAAPQSSDSQKPADQAPAATPQAPAATTPQAPAASAPQTPAATTPDDQSKNDDKGTDKDAKESKDPQPRHDGSKKDVDAIGNRKVGGLDWYSIEKEIRMGKAYAQQVEQSVKLIQDPVVNEYVNRIGQNLVRNSDAKVPFTIKVIDSDEVNAFALPGGFFYVNSGLILAADEEAELAGVMAHEIAHVAARHATRGQTRADIANIATIPLIFIGGGIGYAARQVAGIGLPLTFLSFSRAFEAEADYLGLQYMYKAGYDPNAFVAFFEKLESQEKKKPGTLAKAFRTHPLTPDRIQKTQEEISSILPGREQYIVTTSEFDQVKARLAAIENRRHLDDQNQDRNKPTLRRTASNSPGKDGDTKDDDRPTLKRRDQ